MSSLGKFKSEFDPASIVDSDTIGSYLLDAAGVAITSTTVGPKQALDVNIASGTITVTAGSEFTEDAAHTSADLGTFILAVRQDTLASSTSADGDYSAIKSDSLGRVYIVDDQANAELDAQTALLTTIDADTGAIATSTASIDTKSSTIITALGDINTELDSQTALLTTIDSDTGAIATSVASIDTKSSTIITALSDVNAELDSQTALLTTIDSDTSAIAVSTASMDTSLNNIEANTVSFVSNVDMVNQAVSVGTTAGGTNIVSSILADRKQLLLANLGSRDAFIGTGTVTVANGFPLYKNSAIELNVGSAIAVKGITASGTADVRSLQLS